MIEPVQLVCAHEAFCDSAESSRIAKKRSTIMGGALQASSQHA